MSGMCAGSSDPQSRQVARHHRKPKSSEEPPSAGPCKALLLGLKTCLGRCCIGSKGISVRGSHASQQNEEFGVMKNWGAC